MGMGKSYLDRAITCRDPHGSGLPFILHVYFHERACRVLSLLLLTSELTNMTHRIRQVYNHLSGSNMASAGKHE